MSSVQTCHLVSAHAAARRQEQALRGGAVTTVTRRDGPKACTSCDSVMHRPGEVGRRKV